MIGCLLNIKVYLRNTKYKTTTKANKDNVDVESIFLNDSGDRIGLMLTKVELGANPTSQQVKEYIQNSGFFSKSP